MEMLIGFDPGLREAGLAVFEGNKLTRATLVRSPEKEKRGPEAWLAMAKAVADELHLDFLNTQSRRLTLVVEHQQVYQQKFWKGDPDDLLQLAGVNGAVCKSIWADRYIHTLPRQWKGTVKKEVWTKRIESKLTPEEIQNLVPCPASLRHNLLDGVGLGLWYLGRLGKR